MIYHNSPHAFCKGAKKQLKNKKTYEIAPKLYFSTYFYKYLSRSHTKTTKYVWLFFEAFFLNEERLPYRLKNTSCIFSYKKINKIFKPHKNKLFKP